MPDATPSTQHAAPGGGTQPDGRPLAIRLRAVAKTFGKGESAVRALRGVDLDVPAGALTMLVGPSGCGKTTLISILAGLLARDAGELAVFGQDLGALRRDRLSAWRRDNVGFIFQQFNLVPQLTVAENVSVPLVLKGESVGAAVRKAHDILATLGLDGRGASAPLKLSGGQQQRVAIARALIHEPRPRGGGGDPRRPHLPPRRYDRPHGRRPRP